MKKPTPIKLMATASFTTYITGSLVQFANNSKNALSYKWFFGDNTISGSIQHTSSMTNPVFVYQAPGNYTVKLSAIGQYNISNTQSVVNVI